MFFPFSAERTEKGKTSRFAYALCMEQLLPEGHEHFSLPASQRQRKKMNHLCGLCASAVKYLPFDFDRFEAKLR